MPQQYSTLILIDMMVVAFYLLILRPQKKRQQAMQKTMRELQPGTRVLLGSGVFGTILTVGPKQATIEVSPGAELTVLKQAIVRVVVDGDEDQAELDEDDVLETGYAVDTVDEPDYSRPTTTETPQPGTLPTDPGDPSTGPDRNNLR